MAEGTDPAQPGAVKRRYCQNCGESGEKLIQKPQAYPRSNVAAAAAIVLTLLTSGH
ncbi:MAG: hypothetical protein ABSF29_14080 [Tepidisphaeraceae bacterium]